VDAVNNLLAETETSNGTSTTSFNVLETKLSGLLQDGVGGEPKVCFFLSIILESSDPSRIDHGARQTAENEYENSL
jgi:hypothetical protein